MVKATVHSTPSRRAVLRGAAVASLATTAIAGVTIAQAAADSLIALGERWQASVKKADAAELALNTIYDSLPEWARNLVPVVQPGDQRRLGLPPYMATGYRASLADIRRANLQTEGYVATGLPEHAAEYRRRRAEGRARVRWWIERYRAAKRARAETGYDAADARLYSALDELSALEDQIAAATPTSFAGALVQLRMIERFRALSYGADQRPDDRDYDHDLLRSTIASMDRLVGGAA